MIHKFLSSSMIDCYYTCKRKFNYRYNNGLIPLIEKDSLYLGSLVHSAMSVLYKTKSYSEAVTHITQTIDNIDVSLMNVTQMEEIEHMEIVAKCFLLAYCEVFGEEILGCIVLESEQRHRKKVGRKGSYFCYFEYTPDLVISYEGKIKIIDFKTASRIDGQYLDKFDISYQTKSYYSYLADLYEVDSMEYRILKKPGIRRKQSESKEQFYERLKDNFKVNLEDTIVVKTIRFDKQLNNYHKKELLMTKKDITHGIKSRIYPMNTSACSTIGRCQYFDLCHRGKEAEEMYKISTESYAGKGEVVEDK